MIEIVAFGDTFILNSQLSILNSDNGNAPRAAIGRPYINASINPNYCVVYGTVGVVGYGWTVP